MARSSKSKKSTKETNPLGKIGILIGVPSGGSPESQFLNSLSNLTAKLTAAQIPYLYCCIESCNLVANRHHIVRFALRQPNITHILWIDDDMEFDVAAIKYLLSAAKPVVGVSVLKRKEDPCFTAGDFEGKQIIIKEDSTGLVKAESLGLGLTLMDINIFRLLEPPWFQFPFNKESDDYEGEDIQLFWDIQRKLGIDTWCSLDASKHVNHVGKKVYKWTQVDHQKYPEDYFSRRMMANEPQKLLDDLNVNA